MARNPKYSMSRGGGHSWRPPMDNKTARAPITAQERDTNILRSQHKKEAADTLAQILSPKDRDRPTLLPERPSAVQIDHSHPSSTNQHRQRGTAGSLWEQQKAAAQAARGKPPQYEYHGMSATNVRASEAARGAGPIQTSKRGAKFTITKGGNKRYIK